MSSYTATTRSQNIYIFTTSKQYSACNHSTPSKEEYHCIATISLHRKIGLLILHWLSATEGKEDNGCCILSIQQQISEEKKEQEGQKNPLLSEQYNIGIPCVCFFFVFFLFSLHPFTLRFVLQRYKPMLANTYNVMFFSMIDCWSIAFYCIHFSIHRKFFYFITTTQLFIF